MPVQEATSILTTQNIITIIISISGSGFSAALVTGWFSRKNNDENFRNSHLIEDKKSLRNFLDEINKQLFMFNLPAITTHYYSLAENTENDSFIEPKQSDYTNLLYELLIKLETYVDINNSVSNDLINAYKNFLGLEVNNARYGLISYLRFQYGIKTKNIEHNIENSRELIILHNKLSASILVVKDCISKYFAHYYPKKKKWYCCC